MLDKITWLGQAGFRIKFADLLIYIDPCNLKEYEPADIVLITHGHYDHCSSQDVRKIQKENTVIITTSDCAAKLSLKKDAIKTITPCESLSVKQVDIKAVPAYNLNKPFHPKANAWVGFVFAIKGSRIYHAGDTDFIPEMNEIETDIAMLPVGGTYTMDAQEAADAANSIKPQIAIPMHYGSIKEAECFRKLCRVNVEILN